MTMICIVIALALEMFTSGMHVHRVYDWMGGYSRWVRGWFGDAAQWQGPLGVLAVLLLPVLVVALLQAAFHHVLLGLLSLLLGIAVLVYCLRYQPSDQRVDEVVDLLEQGDPDAAVRSAEAWLGVRLDPERDLALQIADAYLRQSLERLFSVIFWFAVLGPLGAVLYRMTWHLANAEQDPSREEGADKDFAQAARRLQGVLDWVPARLLAAGFAVVGSFEEAVHEWREVSESGLEDWQDTNEALVMRTGKGAMGVSRYCIPQEAETEEEETGEVPLVYEPETVRAARGIVLRSLLAWSIVIALITLAGWAS